MTHTDRIRCLRRATELQVMDLLEWDTLTYTMFKYECGLMYLTAYLKGDKDAIDQMQRSAIYWGWWKLHRMEREREFLDNCRKGHCHPRPFRQWVKGVHGRRANYKIIHNPDMLSQAMEPRGIVLENSYCANLVPALKLATPSP